MKYTAISPLNCSPPQAFVNTILHERTHKICGNFLQEDVSLNYTVQRKFDTKNV